MTAYNIVRVKVKPGHEKEFLDHGQHMDPAAVERMRKNGFRKLAVVKTGDRSYCFIGEWDNFNGIVKSRPDLLSDLDKVRDILEDLGNGLGVTDPVSGEAVFEM